MTDLVFSAGWAGSTGCFSCLERGLSGSVASGHFIVTVLCNTLCIHIPFFFSPVRSMYTSMWLEPANIRPFYTYSVSGLIFRQLLHRNMDTLSLFQSVLLMQKLFASNCGKQWEERVCIAMTSNFSGHASSWGIVFNWVHSFSFLVYGQELMRQPWLTCS